MPNIGEKGEGRSRPGNFFYFGVNYKNTLQFLHKFPDVKGTDHLKSYWARLGLEG